MNSGDIWLDGLWALLGIFLPLIFVLVIILGKNRYTSSRSMKTVTEHKMTGSIDPGLVDNNMLSVLASKKPLAGLYLLPEGGILPFTCAEPEDDGSLEHLDTLADWHVSQDAIRFLLYALERDDWKREFSEWESTLEETLLLAKRAVERDKLRRSLRVIDGGLQDNITPGGFREDLSEDGES